MTGSRTIVTMLLLAGLASHGCTRSPQHLMYDNPRNTSLVEPRVQLLVFSVKHVPDHGTQFVLTDDRTNEGAFKRTTSQAIEPGKLVVSYLDDDGDVRRWEVVNDPLATGYEYARESDSTISRVIVHKDSSGLSLMLPFDPLVAKVRFESIDTQRRRTLLSTVSLVP